MRRLLLAAILLTFVGSAGAKGSSTAIVVEGPHAGVRLQVSEPGVAVNDRLEASGAVVVDSHCSGPHYHGTLKGKPDPDPQGCGWGRAVWVSSATDLVIGLSGAIDYEEQLLVTPGGQHAAAALQYLSNAERALRSAKTLSARTATRIRTLIEQARALDYKYHDNAARETRFLVSALERKRAALALAIDAGRKVSEAAAVAPPACKGSFGLARAASCFKSDTWDVNVPLGVRSALCDFRAGTRKITGSRPLFPGVEQAQSCTVTGRTRIVDGVRKRVVHAELKLTVPAGAKAVAPKQVSVAVRWPA